MPEPLHSQWQQYASELVNINQINVPRWLNYSPDTVKSLQLHAFCDGSTSAYASSVYLRIQYADCVYIHLIIAKSKVTPSKPITIPRTELCAAELATRLASWVNKNLRVSSENMPLYFWTDATIVLHWLNGDPSRLKTFVANRVSKILKSTTLKQWRHVGTHDNPADCATRGLSPTELATFNLWWKGPIWLSQPEESWPTNIVSTANIDDVNAEVKSSHIHVHVNVLTGSIISLYSSFTKLIRIVAWILRYTYNTRSCNQSDKKTGPLTVEELHAGTIRIVKLVQSESFGREIHLLQSTEPLSSKSELRGLAPFIDSDGVLRARGRLQRSNLSFHRKHPILLPAHHHFTDLLIDRSHLNTLHGGVQLALAYLRQKFWIVNARQVIRSRLNKCIKCFRNKPIVATQNMKEKI